MLLQPASVPDKNVSDDFMHAVLSNCTTKIVLPAPKVFSSESLPHNFNMAAVGVMKKGMSMKAVSDGASKNKLSGEIQWNTSVNQSPDAGGNHICL